MNIGETVYDSCGWSCGKVITTIPANRPDLVNPYLDYVRARVIFRDGVYVVYR